MEGQGVKDPTRSLPLSFLARVTADASSLESDSVSVDVSGGDDASRAGAGWDGQYESTDGVSGPQDNDVLAVAAKAVALAALRNSFHHQSVGAVPSERDCDENLLSGLYQPSLGTKEEEEDDRSSGDGPTRLQCLVTDPIAAAQSAVAAAAVRGTAKGGIAGGTSECHPYGVTGTDSYGADGAIHEGESIFSRSRDQQTGGVFQCREGVVGRLVAGDEHLDCSTTPRPKRLDDSLNNRSFSRSPTNRNVSWEELEVLEARMMERLERVRRALMKVHTVLCQVLVRPLRGESGKTIEVQNHIALLVDAANLLEQTSQYRAASGFGTDRRATIVEPDDCRGPPSGSYSTGLEDSVSNLTLDSLRTAPSSFSRPESLSFSTADLLSRSSRNRSMTPNKMRGPHWSHSHSVQGLSGGSESSKFSPTGALAAQATSRTVDSTRGRETCSPTTHVQRFNGVPPGRQEPEGHHLLSEDRADSGGAAGRRGRHFRNLSGGDTVGCSSTEGGNVSFSDIAQSLSGRTPQHEGREVVGSCVRLGCSGLGMDSWVAPVQLRNGDESGECVAVEHASFDSMVRSSSSREDVGALEALATLSSLASCVGMKNQSGVEAAALSKVNTPSDPTLFVGGSNSLQHRNLLQWLVSQARTFSPTELGLSELEDAVQRSPSSNIHLTGQQSAALSLAHQLTNPPLPGSLGVCLERSPVRRCVREDVESKPGTSLGVAVGERRPIDQTALHSVGERDELPASLPTSGDETFGEQNDGVGTGRADWIVSLGGPGSDVLAAFLQRGGPCAQPPQRASLEILDALFEKMFKRLEILLRLTPELLHILPDTCILRKIERENRLTVHVFSAALDAREVSYTDPDVVSGRNAAVFIAPALNRISCSTLDSMLHFCNEQRLVPSIARLAMIGSNCFSAESGRKWMKKCFQEAIRSLAHGNAHLYKVASVGTHRSSPRTGPQATPQEWQVFGDTVAAGGGTAGDPSRIDSNIQDGRSSAAEEIVVLNSTHDSRMEIYKSSGGDPAPFIRPGDPMSQCSDEIWRVFVTFLDRAVTQPQNGRYGVAMTAKYTGPKVLNRLPLGLLEWMVQLALSRSLLNYDSRSRCVWVNRPLHASAYERLSQSPLTVRGAGTTLPATKNS